MSEENNLEGSFVSIAGNALQDANSSDQSAETAAGLSGRTPSADQGATGPRTLQGKERSSRNATTHGILSKDVVLKGESRAAYESLLARFQEYFQPKGAPEEMLVEKLAVILWRHRRLIAAEGGEIRKNVQFFEWDKARQQKAEAEEIMARPKVVSGELLNAVFENKQPLVQRISNQEILDFCLRLLEKLRNNISSAGFSEDLDVPILDRIYGGESKDRLEETLHDTYAVWFETSQAPEDERQREGYASPAKCQQIVIKAIGDEITRLKRFQEDRGSIETEGTRVEALRRRVPEGPGLDRLLRYEASLDRSFDRTLIQLERLQRMRLGQPVVPPIGLHISG